MISGAPAETIRDSKAEPIDYEKIDLEITAYLELNARMSFAELAGKVNASANVVKYHYDKLRSGGVFGGFDFHISPYPVEISAFHEFMLEFKDGDSMNRFFSVAKKLFFIHHLAKELRRDALLVRTTIVDSLVENMFTFFSELVNAEQLTSYSTLRLNMDSRVGQVISYDLFDPVSGWQWDVYQNLLELNKL